MLDKYICFTLKACRTQYNWLSIMYRSGERRRSHRKLYLWLLGFVCFCIAAAAVAVNTLHSTTNIAKPPAAVTRKITYDDTNTTQFIEPVFSIYLPSNWKLISTGTDPYLVYHFQSTQPHEDARYLDVYVDSLPTNLGVNRILPVLANGAQLTLTSTDVSDNCSSFTRTSAKQPTESTHAKWNNIDFYCDLADYERDLVGIGSPEGFNLVTLKGPATGTHKIFITYTDNTQAPDYSIFTSALKTFRIK